MFIRQKIKWLSTSIVLLVMFFTGFSVDICRGASREQWRGKGHEQRQTSKYPVKISDSSSPAKSIEILTENGGRIDWSRKKNLITFDRRGVDGFYDIYTMNPDGSNEWCLTCDNAGLPGKHMGQPAWHPSGDYIAFQAEKRVHKGKSFWAEPGRGIHNDLWLITSDGKRAYELRALKSRMGLLHPHFSHDGSKLFWAERLGRKRWALQIADFVIDATGPHLENIRTYKPGAGLFYESHGFSKDGKKILFSGNLEAQEMSGLDIYTLDLETRKLERLTTSLKQWDEHAQFSPSGKKIVWMSSDGTNWDGKDMKKLRTELWMMNADGSNKARLTYFNKPGYPEYTGERIVVGDSAWSPDGMKLAIYLILPGQGTAGTKGRIVMMTFREPQ